MELKAYEIININEVFNKIAQADVNIKTAISVARNIKELETPIKLIQEKQKALFDEYAEKDEQGNYIPGEVENSIRITQPDEFRPKLQEIMDADIDVTLRKLKISDLEGVKLSANDIRILDTLLEDDEESTEA